MRFIDANERYCGKGYARFNGPLIASYLSGEMLNYITMNAADILTDVKFMQASFETRNLCLSDNSHLCLLIFDYNITGSLDVQRKNLDMNRIGSDEVISKTELNFFIRLYFVSSRCLFYTVLYNQSRFYIR